MPVVVRLICWANGAPLNCAGEYIREVDTQIAATSYEWLTTTPSIGMAKRWSSPMDFCNTYLEPLHSDPIRPDGKPNRPLTALTVEIERVEE